MLSKKVKHNRIKPKVLKDKKYLAYMHNSYKCCLVCGDTNIELHHIKTKTLTDRADNRIVPLCSEHHRGKFSPHGFDSNKFYEQYPKEELLKMAEEFYNEYIELYS